MEYFGPSNTKVGVQLSPSAHARAGREFFFFRGKIDERKALQRALAKFNEHRRAYKALEVGMLSPMQGGGGWCPTFLCCSQWMKLTLTLSHKKYYR